MLPTHVALPVHALPHLPQLVLVLSGMHALFAPPHWSVPLGQSHMLFWHVSPFVHGMLQPPQCRLLVTVFTH